MSKHFLSLALVGFAIGGVAIGQGAHDRAAVERGREAVRGRPALNPAPWTWRAFEKAWTQWGIKEKPADYDRAFRERYGLHPASYENHGLPMGMHQTRSLLGKGVSVDCLLCHSGKVAGQGPIIGLGNSSLDLQAIFDELSAADGMGFAVPFQASYVRGTIDPVTSVIFLMEIRDPDLNIQQPAAKLDRLGNVCSDPPAWWQLKKKKTRNWPGNVDARSVRVDMVNILHPFNSGDFIKKQESVYADIHAFVMSVEAPRYPFPINHELARRGRELFNDTCTRCHGSYGPDGMYPNKVVPFDTIRTDDTLARAITTKNHEYFNRTWFAKELDGDGKPYILTDPVGFQAPPLDGVWATAPYFHNSSVATVYHVLNSQARPKIFTRSYRSEKDDYDPVKLGLRTTLLDQSPGPMTSPRECRQIYDTTLPGRGNGGHTFGDHFTDDERFAVIEYLKTL